MELHDHFFNCHVHILFVLSVQCLPSHFLSIWKQVEVMF